MNLQEFFLAMEQVFLELWWEKIWKLTVKYKWLKREEKQFTSGKDASKFIMTLIKIKQEQVDTKKEIWKLKAMTDPEVIEMGYWELQFDNLDNLKLRMKINYIPFGT